MNEIFTGDGASVDDLTCSSDWDDSSNKLRAVPIKILWLGGSLLKCLGKWGEEKLNVMGIGGWLQGKLNVEE